MLVLRMVEEQFHRDTEDRPIREGRTPASELRAGEIEYRTCPYAGSRYMNERPMNVSALRQTSAHWDDVIDAVAALRVAYTAARGGYRRDVMDIWRLSQLGSALPWFFILREGATCPAYAAALSKATLGVGIWAWRVFANLLAERRSVPAFTSQMIVETAEATGTLLSDTEVCSASDKMMLRFFDPFTAEAVRVAGAGGVARIVEASDEVLRFGAHYIALKQWIWMYWLARRALYADIELALGPQAALAERMEPTGEPPDFVVVEPANIGEMPLAARAQWFGALANLVEPFAPDGSDAPMREHARAIAAVMSELPARHPEIADEVARVVGARADVVARALGQYAALDALLGDVLATVERGFRGDASAVFDAAMRDRIIALPPRAVLAAFAPSMFAAITRP